MMYGLHRSVSTMDDAPSVGCRGTFTVGTASAVTRESDSGKADFSASDTGVDGCRVFLSCAYLSSGSLFLGQGPDLLLSCPELSLKRRAPTAAVSCHVFPALCADVQDFQVALADILVAQLGTAYRFLAWGKRAILDVLRYAPIFHPAQVAEPAQPSLSEQRVHVGETSAFKDLGIRQLFRSI